jgi:hypothetical protein
MHNIEISEKTYNETLGQEQNLKTISIHNLVEVRFQDMWFYINIFFAI